MAAGTKYPNGVGASTDNYIDTTGLYLTGLLASSVLNGSVTWDPAAILDGDMESKDITVTGAALGDFVLVSFSLDTADLTLTAQVTATNTVTATLANNTGASVNLASGTCYVRVLKRA